MSPLFSPKDSDRNVPGGKDHPSDHSAYYGPWEDAFDKYGYDDGDGLVGTYEVERVLIDAGYEVECVQWGLHNVVIEVIRKGGIDAIPTDDDEVCIGYSDPRDYLPQDIIALLDLHFSGSTEQAAPEREATKGYVVTLTRIVNYEVRIDACSPEDAMDRALSVDANILDADHVVGGEITADFATLDG
tara:strand:- start:2819 stop:3379 length:561 start_codon:yes stop_codon:yes gene_type:complete